MEKQPIDIEKIAPMLYPYRSPMTYVMMQDMEPVKRSWKRRVREAIGWFLIKLGQKIGDIKNWELI